MSGLLAKKLAQQVTEIRSSPDNKRCFNCESLGTTYYVPQFSIFVCTSCSGIHMQFGHRVKSVTLADYKADEVEHMKEGGNQVAAYKFLARYTPDKDLRKPIDRNPQRVRIWVQTVFIDKRFYSADAPIPRRSQDGSGAATPAALPSPSGSLGRTSDLREGSSAPSPLPGSLSSPVTVITPIGSRGLSLPSSSTSPPVKDMRELLGDRATVLHVGPKPSGEQGSSSTSTSRASSVAGLPPAPAVAPQASPKPPPSPAFDPFAAPEAPVTTPAMQPVPAAPAAGSAPAAAPQATQSQQAATFDPFGQQAAAAAVAAGPVAPAAPAAVSNGWDAFEDAPTFHAPSGAPAAAVPAAVASAAAVTHAAVASTAADSNNQWATFGDDAFGGNAFAAVPAQAAPATNATPAAPAPTSAAEAPAAGASAAAVTSGSTAPPSVATTAAGATGSSTGGAHASAAPAGGSAPVTPSGSSKGGKPPAKELAADLFADFAYPQPVAAVVSPYQQSAVTQLVQQPQLPMAAPPAAAGWRPVQSMVGPQLQQMPYGMMPGGYGMPQQQQPQQLLQQQPPQQLQQQHAWQLQQQQGMAWHHQQQAAMGMYGAMRPQGYPQPQQPVAQYGMMGMNGMMMTGGYGAAVAMGSMQQQPQQQQQQQPQQQQQQQQANPTSPSWTANTTVAGVTEENAFADLVDLKKDLPSVNGAPTAAAGAATPVQHQPHSMLQMSGAVPPYAAPGGFVAAGVMQQPYMVHQQLPYAGMAGMYTGVPAAPHGAAAAAYGMPPATAPRTSEDSGNPFA